MSLAWGGVFAQTDNQTKPSLSADFTDLFDLAVTGQGQTPMYRIDRRPERVISGFIIGYGTGSKDNVRANWLVRLGGDFGVARNFSVGFEIMPSVFSVEEESIPFQQVGIPFNAFVNLKGGVHLGGLIPFLDFLKVFAGAGGGVGGMLTFITYNEETVEKLAFEAAVHVLYGIELDFGAVGIVAEFQKINIMVRNQNPDPWVNYFIIGLRLF